MISYLRDLNGEPMEIFTCLECGKEYVIHKVKKNEKGEIKLGYEVNTIKCCPFCGR